MVWPPEDGYPSSISCGGRESNWRPSKSRKSNAITTRPPSHMFSICKDVVFINRLWLNDTSLAVSKTKGVHYLSLHWHVVATKSIGELSQFKVARANTLRRKTALIMAALCNRADHYIFALCMFSSFFLLLYFFCSPNLSGRRLDVYHTSTHGVALARI